MMTQIIRSDGVDDTTYENIHIDSDQNIYHIDSDDLMC